MSRRIRVTPELVLRGYCAGLFPMGGDGAELEWYSPDPRCIFELDAFHVPQTLRKTMRRRLFEIRVNTAFDETIRACADREDGTWISEQIVHLYSELHRSGYAHTVEAWQDGKLVGGLYGVAIGAAFFGESMFHRVTDASKVTLVSLVERLRARGYQLLDTQWSTPHLRRFGAVNIPRDEYLARLAAAIVAPRSFVDGAPVTAATRLEA
jgi:leucyl/phenylalanyl-tRNA--protein transferase